MNAQFDPYPEMRDSGVSWLGLVPEHWQVRRLGSIGRFSASGIDKLTVVGESRVGMVNYLDVFDNPMRLLDASRTYQQVSCPKWKKVIHNVRCGDLIFTPSSETPQDVGVSAVCTEDLEDTVYSYHVLRFRLNLRMNLHFKKYWCNCRPVLDQFSARCKGTTRQILTRGDFRSTWTVVPPLPEQRAIVRFLDHSDRRIQRYIRAKERLIELLEEYKQAIIHQSVTGQIDVRTGQPYPDYKNSGVEWLGEVPEHWQRRRLKTLLRSVDRRSTTGKETLLSLRRDHGIVVYSEHFSRPSQGKTLVGYKLVKMGQLVVNRLQANNGLIFNSEIDGVVSPDYSVFEQKTPLGMDYLGELLRTSTYRSHFRRVARGLGTGTAGFLRLYDDTLLSTSVYLPPEPEQNLIGKWIAQHVATCRRAKDQLRHELQLIDEYRTRLIADVVTGKLDVREAAASLPEIDFLATDETRDEIEPTINEHPEVPHLPAHP